MTTKSKENKRLVENICFFNCDLDQKNAKNKKMETFCNSKIQKIDILIEIYYFVQPRLRYQMIRVLYANNFGTHTIKEMRKIELLRIWLIGSNCTNKEQE